MPTSQFTVYQSTDTGAPTLTNAAGTLLALLDAVLVGTAGVAYGSKASAGWTKPIANSGNCGHYKQGAGNGYFLFVNDNGPNVTSTTQEAWLTGWETMSSIAAPVGAGTGQFPTPAQLLTTGHVVVRKVGSIASFLSNPHPWTIFADSRTFYLFVGGYSYGWAAFFGDFYSTKTPGTDIGNCIIVGQAQENTDAQTNWEATTNNNAAISGHYANRSYTNLGGSVSVGKHGDKSLSATSYQAFLSGGLLGPNMPDNRMYLSPIYITETSGVVRGFLRGMYHHLGNCQTYAYENQQLIGTGRYAGRTFQMTLRSNVNAQTRVAIDISNLLETN